LYPCYGGVILAFLSPKVILNFFDGSDISPWPWASGISSFGTNESRRRDFASFGLPLTDEMGFVLAGFVIDDFVEGDDFTVDEKDLKLDTPCLPEVDKDFNGADDFGEKPPYVG